jgi:hypothetical protein
MFDQQLIGDMERYDNSLYWRQNNPERRARFAKFFEGDEFELKNDEVLQNRGVGSRELEMRRRYTETLMENTIKEAYRSLNAMRSKFGTVKTEATITTSDIAAFTTWSVPLIRKIWPRLFAHEIVGMQTMSQPTGKAFTIDHQFAQDGGTYDSGTSIYPSEDPDFSDDLGEGVTPRKLKAVITGADITATAKKLITDWTIESAQDFNAYHGISLNKEMVAILGDEIEREKNRVIINGVSSAATTNTNWDSSQGVSPDPWSNATPHQFNETLWDSIADANKEIYDRVYEDANVILAGSTMATRLEKLSSFKLVKQGPATGEVVSGPNLFGTLSGKYKVFKDPYYTADKMILVHKSSNWMYTGYVHLTYVPMWLSPLIPTNDFTFSQGVMSRYANYNKNGDFFATVTAADE